MGTRAFDELARHSAASLRRRERDDGVSAAPCCARPAAARRRTRAVQPRVRSGARRPHEAAHRRTARAPEIADALAALDVDAGDVLALIVGDPTPLSGAARAGERAESRRRSHGLPAARRLLHRRRDRTLRRRATDRVAARLSNATGARRVGIDAPRRRRAGVVRHGALHDVRVGLLPPHDAHVRAHPPRGARASSGPIRARSIPIEEFLAWDDFRVLDALAGSQARRRARCANAFASTRWPPSSTPNAICAPSSLRSALLRDRFGARERVGRLAVAAAASPAARRWASEQTVWVAGPGGVVDAREASDLIAKLSGKAYWRKLFVRRDGVDVAEAAGSARKLSRQVSVPNADCAAASRAIGTR